MHPKEAIQENLGPGPSCGDNTQTIRTLPPSLKLAPALTNPFELTSYVFQLFKAGVVNI